MRERRWNLREWEAYRRAVASGGRAEAGRETLDEEAVRLERLYLGLRTAEGVPAALVPEGLAEEWEGQGWARRDGGAARLTPRGWLLLDALVARAAA